MESAKPDVVVVEKPYLDEVEKAEEMVKIPVLKEMKKKLNVRRKKNVPEKEVIFSGERPPETSSRFGSTKLMNCRCRPSAVRGALDKVRKIIQEETWYRLEAMNLVQFFDLPPYPQDHVLTMHIFNCWDIDRRTFNFGGKEVGFNANQVALLIGLPNRGPIAIWNKGPLCNVTAVQIKEEFENVSPGESSDRFIALFLKFLLTNLLFPSANFKVSQGLYSLCEQIDVFSSYNWPATICNFLTKQLNETGMKIRMEQPFGYINGFVYLMTIWFYEHTSLVVPDVRPRMLRWPVKVRWNSVQIEMTFSKLNPSHVYDHFLDLKDNEHALLDTPTELRCDTPQHLPQQETQSNQPSPIPFQLSNIVPSNTPHTPRQIGLDDIYHLLSDVVIRLTTVENTLSEVNLKVSEIEKRLKQPRGDSARTQMKESPTFSLIKRIKARGSRRKRQITSPFRVFERKRRKKTLEKVVDDVNKVDGDNVPSQQMVEAAEEMDPQLYKEHNSQQPLIQEELSIEEEVQVVHKEQDNQELVIEKKLSTDEAVHDTHGPDYILLTGDEPDVVCPAPPVIDFPGKEQIPDFMRETIDICCSKFTDYGSFLITGDHVSLTRRYLDDLLTNRWLGNEHVDCFALLMEMKRRKEPSLYMSYVYVSPQFRMYQKANMSYFVNHITTKSMQKVDIILMTIIDNGHWTLLVGLLREKKMATIRFFEQQTSFAYHTRLYDLTQWPVVMAKGVPVQRNSIDCGVFVCKYMEALVQKSGVNWTDKLMWQDSMTLFRAEIGYEISKFALSEMNLPTIEATHRNVETHTS